MGKKISFVKGLAAGAVLAAAASLIMDMRDGKGQKAKQVQKTVMDIGKKVARHAMHIGKLSKEAHLKIIDTVIAEHRGARALSKDDVREIKAELKEGWAMLKHIASKKKKR
jgi:hypothetical protein